MIAAFSGKLAAVAFSTVIAGLDPAIHLLRKGALTKIGGYAGHLARTRASACVG
jgi:hypothetical protein